MHRRHLLSLLLLAIVPPSVVSCYSIERTAAGYQRRGVWLPHREQEGIYEGKTSLTLEEQTFLYDANLGVYVVQGPPDLFYLGGWYYRLGSNGWEISRSLAGAWSSIEVRLLPPGLRRYAAGL